MSGATGVDVDDPSDAWLTTHLPTVIGILVAVLVVILVLGWLSWRFHDFRITDELLEERSGLLRRRHRKGRIDRIQGVDVQRPILPRIFGAARLDVSLAGDDGNIRLAYLSGSVADELRNALLARAALLGAAARGAPASTAPPEAQVRDAPSSAIGDALDRRVGEFFAPELDSPLTAPESIVTMHPGRVIGSTLLSMLPGLVVFAAALALVIALTGEWLVLVGFLPVFIGAGSYAVRRTLRALRYTVAATPYGLRIGFGLLSTTNETLPPGRIHAIRISQPLLWRAAGWWSVDINRASKSSRRGADSRSATTILPVGTLAEAQRVVDLIVPGAVPLVALVGRDEDGGFVVSPPRARWVRWWSRRRNGVARTAHAVLIRRGAIWRTLTIVPEARVQSVAFQQGPIGRATRLARVAVHTVSGPVEARVGALDEDAARAFAAAVETETIRALAASPR